MRPHQRLYWVWSAMLGRCRNPRDKAFARYGGRGIRVCERWFAFKNFLEDMGQPLPGRMLDRYPDNDGDYEPANCRWATREEQNSNRRNCIYVDADGERITLKEACRRKGLKYRPIVKRIRDRQWTIERALSVPIRQQAKIFFNIEDQ